MSLNVKISGFIDEAAVSLDEQISIIKSLGEHYMCPRDIDGRNISTYTVEEFKNNIKPKLDEAGIKFSSIGSPIGKIDFDDEEGFIRQKEELKNLIDIAKLMGTKYIRIFSFYYKDKNPDDIFDIVVKKLKEFLDIAKGSGVVLMHENEKYIYGDKAYRVLKLYDALKDDGLVLTFDASNYVQCDENVKEAFDKTIKYTKYIHIKDCGKWKVEVPLGLGEGQYEYIFKRLNELNYSGFLTLEPHTFRYVLNKERVNKLDVREGEDLDYFNTFKMVDAKLGIEPDKYLTRKEVYLLQYKLLKEFLAKYNG
ncbi:MAG: sugar phosphate isomerase/epimerase [Gammaproteobacteria bacterium]|nr:sugar phosphate isomerase/epimerase [Gammaproteobacteria bacterium]